MIFKEALKDKLLL